jgi:hypothetical protein
MRMAILLVLISLNSYARSKDRIRLKLGETYVSQELPIQIHLKKFHTTKTECAVPGFNCGSGYTPNPVTTPVVEFLQTNPECTKSPRPKFCEWNFKIVATDNKTYVDIEIVNIYEFCMGESNKSNRNSCIIRTTVGNDFNPMHSPDNCNRADDPEIKNNCFEMMAENLNDPKLCEKVIKPYGRRCILFLARAARDPAICQQLKTAPLNQSEENERQVYMDRCQNEIKQLNATK